MNYAQLRTGAIRDLCESLGVSTSQAMIEVDHIARHCGLGHFTDVDDVSQEALNGMVFSRMSGKPLGHILGNTEFMSLEISCGPQALVPRPETEILVETVLAHVKDGPIDVGDLGSGSGAIAAALALSLPSAEIFACDASGEACSLTRSNIASLGLQNVKTIERHWEDLDMEFDALVSNPPYVTSALCERMSSNGLLHDPLMALDGGADGLHAYRSVLVVAKRCLKAGGEIFLEHGVGQYPAVRDIAMKAGLVPTGSYRDLQGLRRIFQACKAA